MLRVEVFRDNYSRGHWTRRLIRFKDEAPLGAAPSPLRSESIAPLLVKLHLMFLFHGELTYNRDSVIVE